MISNISLNPNGNLNNSVADYEMSFPSNNQILQ